MIKHTPGPWHWNEGSTYILSIPRREERENPIVADVKSLQSAIYDLAINATETPTAKRLHEERRANCRLIAAAPETLAALEALVKVAERQLPQGPDRDGLTNCDTIAAARAAIRKATGQP